MVKRKHSNFDVYDKELNALYKSVVTGRRPGTRTMRTNKPPDAIMSDPLPSIPGVPKVPPKITQTPRPPTVRPIKPPGKIAREECWHDGCNRVCRLSDGSVIQTLAACIRPPTRKQLPGRWEWEWDRPGVPIEDIWNPDKKPDHERPGDWVWKDNPWKNDDPWWSMEPHLESLELQMPSTPIPRQKQKKQQEAKILFGEGIFFEGQFVPKYKLDQNPTKYGLPSRIAKAYRPRRRRL